MARGRNAENPTEIPVIGWKDVALRVKDELAADRVTLLAAGVAFYGLLALFPAITAVIAISGLLVEPAQIVGQLRALSGLVPQQVLTIITDQATSVAGSRSGGLGLAAGFGLLLALYSASKGMSTLMQGLNVAYDEEETRGFIKLKLVTFALTLFLILGLLAGLGATLAVPAIVGYLNIGPGLAIVLNALPWVGLVLLTVLGLSAVYRYGPSRDPAEWKWVSAGAVLGCALWIAASGGFAFYVSNFGSYNESFGTLGGVIVLLMWFWISAFIILLGGELNAELEAQTSVDSTRGKDQPMGQRDAVKADNLGEAAQ